MQLNITQEEVRQKYATLASEYRQKSWVNENIFGIKHLRQSLLNKAKGRTLEVASGTGENFRYLTQTTSLTAVDLSPDMLEIAEQEAQQLNMNVDFQVMQAENLDFVDDCFDTVISTMSTCTFADPLVSLREMQRVCRPDGCILLIEHGRSRWVHFI